MKHKFDVGDMTDKGIVLEVIPLKATNPAYIGRTCLTCFSRETCENMRKCCRRWKAESDDVWYHTQGSSGTIYTCREENLTLAPKKMKPKFKVGDVVMTGHGHEYIISKVSDEPLYEVSNSSGTERRRWFEEYQLTFVPKKERAWIAREHLHVGGGLFQLFVGTTPPMAQGHTNHIRKWVDAYINGNCTMGRTSRHQMDFCVDGFEKLVGPPLCDLEPGGIIEIEWPINIKAVQR